MWKDGNRRSPRISALDVRKAQRPTRVRYPVEVSQNSMEEEMEQDSGNEVGPPSWTRARKKRKLRPVEQVARDSPNHGDHPTNSDQPLVVKAKDSPKHEDHATYTGQTSVVSSATWMPEKRILELILDILQRRDTHEIFAEPVDPKEVEDYYEIIKEPMDFGTMRAKLHEGMYKNLEQFEHDIFLISRNAMHFNSSGTIFFRQARAIHELAKKVFHVLKTEPENLELEFSVTRRRTGRKAQGEVRGSNFGSCPKHDTNVRSSNMTIDLSSKYVPCSLSGSSNLRKSVRVTPWCSGRATQIDTRGHEILSVGGKDGRRSNFLEADRRCTYRPWMSFLNESDSIVSTIYSNPKLLAPAKEQDIGYRESLMLFVKDLGPTAQRIAKRKLHGWRASALNCQTPSSKYWFQAPKCQNPAASASTNWGPTAITVTTSQNLIDHRCGHPTILTNSTGDRINLNDTAKGEEAYTGDGMGFRGASGREMASNNDIKREAYTSSWMNVLGVLGGDKVHRIQNAEIQLGSYSSTAGIGDVKFSDVGNKNTNNKSMTMMMDAGKLDNLVQPSESASEHSQSNVFEFMSRKNDSYAAVSWPLETMRVSSQSKGCMHDLGSPYVSVEEQVIAAPGPSHGINSLSQTGRNLESKLPVPVASQFIFDLPYLKSRLNQMKLLGME
ncbi:hypothetical protein L1049_007569 [Liquidambar formosana]|uniref:Bromo domain-containing protein n=1 Tax=Liquidambar formosana TaxID=63359 RepID=A0AAP0S956_LIQFO